MSRKTNHDSVLSQYERLELLRKYCVVFNTLLCSLLPSRVLVELGVSLKGDVAMKGYSDVNTEQLDLTKTTSASPY